MHDRFERVVSAVLTVAAVAVAAGFVHREFSPQRSPVAATPAPPTRASNAVWEDLRRNSIIVGDTAAPAMILVLGDFECPFCKRFHATLGAVRHEFGPRVVYAFVHFPLPMHRFARPAARAAECASAQARFEQMNDVLYEKQDSLGLKAWASYAADAGIRDTARFARCTQSATPIARIDNGLALATRLGANGTPTVLVNGWMYSVPPDQAELDRAINAILAGRQPYEARP